MKYWGSGNGAAGKQKAGRLNVITQKKHLFMVLVRLRKDTNVKEVSHVFGMSEGHFSKRFST